MLKKIFLCFFVAFFSISLGWGAASAAEATFSWLPNSEADLAGYSIKSSATQGGPYTALLDCKKPATRADGRVSCTVASIPAAASYYVAVAYDSAGAESLPSSEVMVNPAPAAPTGLQYSVAGTVTINTDGTIHLDMVADKQ